MQAFAVSGQSLTYSGCSVGARMSSGARTSRRERGRLVRTTSKQVKCIGVRTSRPRNEQASVAYRNVDVLSAQRVDQK